MNKEEYRSKFLEIRAPATQDEHLLALDDLPDDLPEWAHLYSPEVIRIGSYRIDIPFDLALMKKMRQLLGSAWIFLGKWDSSAGFSTLEYRHSVLPVILSVCMHAKLAGSACKMVEVGEEVTPIYEVQCE